MEPLAPLWGRPRCRALGTGALFCLFAAMDVWIGRAALQHPLGMDYLPLWTAMRSDPTRVYDFSYITHQQAWLYIGTLRPFVYPPTVLLVLAPFGLLPYWFSYAAFVLSTGALYLVATIRLGADWRVLLLPPIVFVAIAGQVTFLVGGLVILAASFRSRPILAGFLYGIAGVIKPQILVLLPVALITEGSWSTIFSTGAAAGILALASLATGADWMAWLHALLPFQKLVLGNQSLVADAITPYIAWGRLGALIAGCFAVGIVWLAFRTGDLSVRIIALCGGALLLSPYAMNYELALLAPAVVVSRSPLRWPATLLVGVGVIHYFGPLALIGASGLAAHTIASYPLQGDGLVPSAHPQNFPSQVRRVCSKLPRGSSQP